MLVTVSSETHKMYSQNTFGIALQLGSYLSRQPSRYSL